MALNQPQMKTGPAFLSPMPSNAGSWFGRRHAATECEVDLALMAKSNERLRPWIPDRLRLVAESAFRQDETGAVAPRRRADRALRRLRRKVPEGERQSLKVVQASRPAPAMLTSTYGSTLTSFR